MIKVNTALTFVFLSLLGCNVEKQSAPTGGVDFGGGGGEAGKSTKASSGGSSAKSSSASSSEVGGSTHRYSKSDGGSSSPESSLPRASEGGAGGDSSGEGGAGGTVSESEPVKPVCERGLVIVDSDFKSTNISITDLEGKPRSSSFVSSGSAKPGLAMALSSDVDVPRLAPASGRVVLLDRFGTNVVTFMELATANVLGQLPVGTGFESNPYDYVEFDTDRALISRYGSNPNPGKVDFDGGGDLLVVDTKEFKILDRIAMPEEDKALLPRPSGMTMLGDTVVVTLERLSTDFKVAGMGRFVGVSPTEKRILWTVEIDGLKNCGRLSKSPSGKIGAMACSSQTDPVTYKYNPEQSDVVIFDLTISPPKELRRLGLGKAVDGGLQHVLEFASESKLIALVYGGNSTAGDRAVAVDVTTGKNEKLLEAAAPYTIMGAHCAPGCSDVCVIADAEKGKLVRFRVSSEGEFSALEDITVDTVVGLPPHYIGAL